MWPMRVFARERLVPVLLRTVAVAPAPSSRWLDGQRMFLLREFDLTAVLDVGANTGQYARRLRLGGCRGVIHSFEPGAEPFRELTGRASKDASWHAYQLALSDKPGLAEVHSWVGAGSQWRLSACHRLA
jgi:hypothetical protein